jgi:hypothetical protein
VRWTWEDRIKTDLKDMDCEEEKQLEPALNRVK